MIITITGTPGSGKSTLAKLLARTLGYQHYSIGDMRRDHAQQAGITLAELNRRSEAGEDTDTSFDEYQRAKGEEEDDFVIDSRLGFHFIPQSLKLFVDADEMVRARRLATRSSVAELASSVGQAELMNRERMESDKARYLKYYTIDPWQLDHYDQVLDSTSASPDDLVRQVLRSFPQLKKKSF